MKFNLPTVAKAYLLLVSLINFNHVFSVLGFTETLVNAPPCFSFWWWHVILVLVYGILPLGAVLGILMESLAVFTMIVDARLVFLLLDTLAVALSLALAVENASIKLAAERLSFERSHF